MQIKIFDNFSDNLLSEFNKYETEFEYFPFQNLYWLKHWHNTFLNNKKNKLKIFVIYQDKIPVLILPFCIKKIFSISILEWAGGLCTDYHGPIINKKFNKIDNFYFYKFWNEILKELTHIDLILLQKQKKFYNIINPFIEYLNNNVYRHKAYQINFEKNFESTIQKKNRKIIYNNKRQYKRLANLGSVYFLEPTEHDKKVSIISKMIELKEQRYIQTKTWNMFADPRYKNFYNNLINVPLNNVEVNVIALICNDEIIACHLGLIHRGTFYYLMPSFDFRGWGLYSPGNILLEFLINNSIKKKLNIFDFSIGDEDYKKKWANEVVNLYEYSSANTIQGFLCLKIYLFLISIKNIKYLNLIIKKISIKIKSWII